MSTNNRQSRQSRQSRAVSKASKFVLDANGLVTGKRLSQGASGAVYVGTFYGKKVAIKEMLRQAERADLDEFARESQFLSQLQSPFVISFYGVTINQIGHLLMVEELCVCSLSDVLKEAQRKQLVLLKQQQQQDQQKTKIPKQLKSDPEPQHDSVPSPSHLKMSTQQRLGAALQVAKGMEYIHSLLIAHRDLKPANVVLDRDGVAKLCDFGIARKMTYENENTIMTGGVGTFTFMAPEVLDGQFGFAEAGLAVDVYAFGMLLWAMLMGEEPWGESSGIKSRFGILRAVMDGERPHVPPAPHMSAEMRELIEACWAQQPDERPTFSDVVATLPGILKKGVSVDTQTNKAPIPVPPTSPTPAGQNSEM